MLEKIAVNLLAGVPAVVKPATVTSYLTEAVVKEIIASNILPKGALQLLCGSAGDMLEHVTSQDIVTFTGSATTGLMLKSGKRILEESVPFTMEADSLNCIVLGDDVTPEMPEWDIFIKEVRKEMTTKCGQKCTAIRRIFVPENKIEDIQIALGKALAQTTIGNPLNSTVRMGSLAGQSQKEEVKNQIQKLLASSQIIYGSLDSVELIDADANKGAFISPILLLNQNPFASTAVHEVEAFGPVSTLMPYNNIEEAIALAKLGKGSLVSSIVTASSTIAKQYVLGAGAYHGRILVLNNECAKESTGHGSPLPLLVHGGPGRAGGGEEMGGMRGVFCSGASFDELAAIQTEKEGLKFFSGFANVINEMRKAPQLIIVRVQGKCVGGGVGLAAAADYAIACEGAEVKLSELAVGIGPFVVGPAVERKLGLSAFSQLTIDASLWRNGDWARLASSGIHRQLKKLFHP
ncbi:unnamed protein product [Rotaria sordida]|uniref:Aldehyde dehydrogenase domain-containing protein n=1 Tax=Rotaria sordida TaxID=392033 RepID=A0A813PL17_9BILA|nr:unnamed protein product [Rotaria sordida]